MNLDEFHFLRPEWFLALLPLLLLLWLLWRQRLFSRSWQAVVDARLLPHLLIGGGAARRRSWPLLLLGLSGLLAITALAGPTWQKLEQPLFRQQSGLVVLLDLSRSMDAADLRPSRLARARLKLIDILKQQREGQTALVAYAATPFVVTPLTSDTRTIISQLPIMTTDLMPAQGSRPDRAIATARQLLQQAGVSHGSVLLISDGVEGGELLDDEIGQLTAAGHRLLILGVGTAAGAPIPQLRGSGFVTDGGGAIVIPKLDDAALSAAAQQGNGLYRQLSGDDGDINALLAVVNGDSATQRAAKVNDMMSDQWQEAGVWLLLPLLLLAPLAFRRGYLAAVVLAVVILPQPETASAVEWGSLWSNRDQQGRQALEQGDAARAAQLFTAPEWRAAAHYRAGEYEKTLELLARMDKADAHYNRGNALAKLGRLPEAVKAYDEALKRDPKMTDARENRDLVKRLLQQQQEKERSNKDGQSQPQQDQPQGGAESEQRSEGRGKEDGQPGQGQQPQPPQSGKEGADQPPASATQPLAAQQNEEQRANEQWLQRIPDDPGGLWRRKFLHQYQQQKQKSGNEERAW